jgi:hypothetical protein
MFIVYRRRNGNDRNTHGRYPVTELDRTDTADSGKEKKREGDGHARKHKASQIDTNAR